jgi:hypothetical protein
MDEITQTPESQIDTNRQIVQIAQEIRDKQLEGELVKPEKASRVEETDAIEAKTDSNQQQVEAVDFNLAQTDELSESAEIDSSPASEANQTVHSLTVGF